MIGSSLVGEIFEFQKFRPTPARSFPGGFRRDVQVMEYDSLRDQLFVSKLMTEVYQLSSGKFSEYNFSASAKDYYFRKDGVVFTSGNQANASVRIEQKELLSALADEFSFQLKDAPISRSGPYLTVPLIIQRNKCIFYQESDHRLWVGLVDGLQSHQHQQWIKHFDPQSGLPIIAVDILELKDGTICVATIDQGIYFIKDGQVIKHLDTKSGLLNNKIRKLATNQESVWMVMANAVQGYQLKEQKFTKFMLNNDVEKEEIYDIEILKDTVYLATSRGIQFFRSPSNLLIRPLHLPPSPISWPMEKVMSCQRNRSCLIIAIIFRLPCWARH